MLKLKTNIFKKLALAFISILFIPFVVLSIYIFRNLVRVQENNLKRDNYYTTLNMIEKISESYIKLERINILIRDDIQFLDFLTSKEEKKPLEYVEFRSNFISKYDKLVSILNEIAHFKIYVDNENLLNIQPIVSNTIPEKDKLYDQTHFMKINTRDYIYYFREIYYYPQSIYLEFILDLEKIIGKSNNVYSFYKFDSIELPNISIIDFDHQWIEDNSTIGILETDEHITFYYYFSFLQGYFVNKVEKDILDINIELYRTFLFISVLLSLTVIYFISYFISLRLFRQLEYILEGVKEVEEGNLEIQIPIKDKTEDFYLLSMQINSMVKRIKELIGENVRKETKSKDFQIKALQSQINSHFIQNTLENIKMIAYINADYQVSEAITNLGKILRYGMDWSVPEVSFIDEMDYIRRYIDLFSIRLDDAIEFRYYAQKDMLYRRFPKMIFQPFVENSILHGIIPKGIKGYIQIRAYTKEGYLYFEILDNGIGSKDIDKPIGNGIGLLNTQNRLKLYFQRDVELKVNSIKGKFTRLAIKVREM